MILCEQSKAALAAAQSASANVQGATERYLQGEYALACQEARTALMVAKDRQRRAKEYLEASRKLEAKGYITPQQLQADEFALKAADTEAQQAEVRILVLENYTRRKKLKDLECALIVGKAKLDAAEYQRKLEIQRLAEIEDQIGKCVVRAPVAGEVVLAHIFHNGHAHMIEPGESTFERRVLVRLPDPRRMQVKAKIEEEKIAAVRPGLPVSIQLEAFPEAQLAGRVLKISEYPDPESFHGSATKLYEAVVRIDTPRDGLRPGLTADVRIGVQRLENQLQLPCQAVIRHGEKSYCLQVRGDRREAREVTVGPSNGKTVVIRGGLEEGETVILAAAAHRDQVVLPDLPPETPLRLPLAFADPKTRAGME
jgi:RND family efflux transporter MFP subunit